MSVKRFFLHTYFLFFAVPILLGAYFVYAVYYDATVYTTTELVVIPGSVESENWFGLESVLVQDVDEFSVSQDFNRINSAYPLAKIDDPFGSPSGVDVVDVSSPAALEPPSVIDDADSQAAESETDSDSNETQPPESGVADPTSPQAISEPAAATEASQETSAPDESTVSPAPLETVSYLRLFNIKKNQTVPLTTLQNLTKAVLLYPLAQVVVEEAVTPLAAPEAEVVTPEVVPVPASESVPVTEAPVVDTQAESGVETVPAADSSTLDVPELRTDTEETVDGTVVSSDQSELPTDTEEMVDGSVVSSNEPEQSDESEANVDEAAQGEEAPVVADAVADVHSTIEPCDSDSSCFSYHLNFTGFAVPEFENSEVLDGAQIRFSLAAKERANTDYVGPQRFRVEYSFDAVTYKTATIIDVDEEISNATNGGNFLVSFDTPPTMAELSRLSVRISFEGNLDAMESVYFDSMWLQVVAGSFYEDTMSTTTDMTLYERDLTQPKFHELNNPNVDYSVNNLPNFTLSYSPQQSFFKRLFTKIFDENTYAVQRITLTDPQGEVIDVPVEVVYQDDTTWTVNIMKQPQKLVAGKYTIELTVNENEVLFTDSFQFYWGVLAVNTTKSMYFAGEDVELNLAALSDQGDTICDADLTMKIIDPKNNIFEIPVNQTGSCGPNNVTEIPDYVAEFRNTDELGVYVVQLQHNNFEGDLVHSIQDSFEVRDYIPFDIERTAPTRIYPPSPYKVSLNINANRDFSGDITERVPRGFVLSNIDDANISTLPEYTLITWKDVTMLEGESLTLSYTFDAPDITPYLFLLGPLDMDGFKELRQWQIASDALTAVAWLTGTQTSVGANLNNSASPLLWSTSTVDSYYFTHSTSTDVQKLTLKRSGDYFVSVTLPQQRTDGNNRRTRVGLEVRVNGVAVPQGLGRSGYIENAGSQSESSSHVNVLLTGMNPNDYIEVYAEGLSTYNAADVVTVTGRVGMYVEFISAATNVFAATTTKTTNSVNLNQATAFPLEWIETRQNSGFSHSNVVNPQNITISNAGTYLVQISVPLNSPSGITGTNPLGRVLLNGVQVSGGIFAQGYLAGETNTSDADSSMHWSGVVVSTTSNAVLTITTETEASAGTTTVPTGFVGSIFIQPVPASETIILRGRDLIGGTDWSNSPAEEILWDTRVVYDATTFTHSTTTNNSQITINAAGDYLLTYNDGMTGTTQRTNNRITITVNGVPVSGAETKSHFMRNQGGHNNSSGALTFLLTGITSGQIVRVFSEQEAGNATMNDTTDAVLVMTKKADLNFEPAAPTTFNQPFDNIRFASTTPHFDFQGSDPDGFSDIVYQFAISTTSDFSSEQLFSSASTSGFINTVTATDTSPFLENQKIRFQLSSSSALSDLTTYYWRVRAVDISGSGNFGDWTTTQSLTVDLSNANANWYQTLGPQFNTNTLVGAVTGGSDSVRVDATLNSEMLMAYGEGIVTTPRYRIWDGSSWGIEQNAVAVGGVINWVDTAAAVSRDEYSMITLDQGNNAYAQIYSASTSSWGNQTLLASGVSSVSTRGIAVGYESNSGDALAVSCATGNRFSYRIWNGLSWSATSSVALSSVNDCNFMKITSDPASDELIMVVRDTGLQYEALVWDGSVWGNSKVLGSAANAIREGIAINYESSGDQAVIVVSNGTANNVLYTTWDGTGWSANSIQATTNDFVYGNLTADPNSDNLTLCYIDASARVGVLRWDGGVWAAPFFNIETTANSATARPTDCLFETTAGRTGNILAMYSDTTDSRYQVFASSAWTTEATITGVLDSFWINAKRAEDGTIVLVNLDDVSDNLESTFWNGTSWSSKQTIENSPSSVIAAPYEMYDLSPKRFAFNSGTVRTPAINFSIVPNQPTWGDISFNTTEPFGTDVKVRVKYTASTTCDTYIPDGTLAGNGTGFDVSVTPINLNGLATSTYSQLCLEAAITNFGSVSATLNDWTLSWVREPKLSQDKFRWYVNGSFITPTDPWPLGVSDLVENGSFTADVAINNGANLRLRMSLLGSNVTQPTSTKAFKLQYAEGFSCSPTLAWRDVGGVGSTTAIWRGFANTIIGSDWLSGSWTKRTKLTIPNSVVASSSTDFPVYVNLNDLPASFFTSVKSDGSDIRVTKSNGLTEVPFQLVSINTSSRTGEIHFKGDLSATTSSEFYIYYGNATATAYANTATFGRNNVWTNGYSLRYSLEESPDDSGPQFKDSTSNNNGATKKAGAGGLTVANLVAGKIGNGINHTAANHGATFTQLSYGGVFTASLWWNASGDGFAIAGPAGAFEKIGPWSSPAGRVFTRVVTSSDTSVVHPADGTWTHVVVTRDSANKVDMYINGSSTRLFGDVAQVGASRWGNFGGENTQAFLGILDEIRFATVQRSAGWIATEFNNQSNPTGFYSVSAEEVIGDGRALTGTLLTGSDSAETYEESNPTNLNRFSIAVGNNNEWDWSLENNGATSSTNYCFRMVYSDSSSLNSYLNYPRLITNGPPLAPSLSAPFDNEQLALTAPGFEFSANDELSDLVSYEIMVDDNADFSSPVITRDSVSSFSLFTNVLNNSERSQYTSGQTIRFVPTTVLSNGVTYYWRVRARDDLGAGIYGDWSTPSSLTVNTATAITTWFQTTGDQFTTNSLNDTVANSGTNDTGIESGFSIGTTTSTVIDYDNRDTGNAWGSFSFNQNITSGLIRYYVEYRVSGENFELIPDSALTGNSSGFTSSPVNLAGLDTTIYNEIRLLAVLTNNSTLPRLLDWTVTWSLTIEPPTTLQPFDNAKVSTTTPSLTFSTTDPQSDDLQYQVQISSSYAFTSSSTFLSGVDAGFVNTINSGDTSPFNSGNTIRYSVQTPLTNGQTYWWRTKARDPGGNNTFSKYSTPKSFTVDTGTTVSTWFQTVGDQFATNDLVDIETTPTTAKITSAIKGVMIAYGEGTGQSPRYVIWNGSTLSATGTALSVGAQIRWLDTEAAPTRPEYALASQGTDLDVNIQIYNSDTEIWSNTNEIQTDIGVVNQRGFDIAYETTSGKLLAVACDGLDAVYSVWNGTSWTATSSLNLANANTCRTVTMESDPNSNEIIAIFEHTNTSDPDYEVQVWNGSSWGSSISLGNITTNGNTGAAVTYEESGNQAMVVVSNGTAASFLFSTWDGLTWSSTTETTVIGNDFAWGSLKRDVGTDRIALCYIDIDNDIGVVEWDGSVWNAFTELELLANSSGGQPVDCEYETAAGRDGYLMVPYSDAGAAGAGAGGSYQFNDGVAWSGKLDLGNLEDSWRVLTVRAKDGIIHSVFFDDIADRYNYVQWDGADWIVQASIPTPSIIGTPFDGSLAMAAQTFPNFTNGSIQSTPITFSDGSGPRWERVTFTDSKPGTSNIRYQVYYQTTPGAYSLIPDSALAGNAAGFTISPINLSTLDTTIYSKLKIDAQFSCVSGNCPTLNDWGVEWSEGITVSGNALAYDGLTPVASGTVAVAVNGVLQVGKIAQISGGGTTTNSQVFSSAGTTTWSVPSGVTQVTIKTWGAGGGGGSGGSVDAGGSGAGAGYIQGTLTVTPGENLLVSVGGGGGAAGASGSAGAGGGGGGYSSVYRSSTPLLVAGAGGGGGGGSRGTPISFTAVGTACAVSGAGCTPTIPAGVQDDVYILVLHSRTDTAHTCTANCTGWTEFSTQAGDATGGRVSTWYLRRGGSAPVDPTFGGPATESYTGRIWGFGGVTTVGNPYGTVGVNTTQAAVATYTGSSLVSSRPDVMSIMVGGSMDNNTWGPGDGSCNTPNGVNASFYSANANGTDNSVFLCYNDNPLNTSGTIAAPGMTIGANGPTDPGRWFNFLLRPSQIPIAAGGIGGVGGGLGGGSGANASTSIGGGGGTQTVGGSASGAATIGASLSGGAAGNGTGGATGGSAGLLGGGAGGTGVGTSTALAAGGGGAAGYFGGGGGSQSSATAVSGAGGGGGSSFITSGATATSTVSGSTTQPGNTGDINYAGGAGVGGTGGASSTAGSAGSPGRVVVTWTATSSNGSWTIQNVPVVVGDIVTVFVDGAATSSRAVGITKYDGTGNITDMSLIQRHVTIGSDDAPTISNVDLGLYDSVDDSDLFQTVSGGNIFNLCGGSGCNDAVMRVKLGATYAPAGNGTVINFKNIGTFAPASSTLRVSGQWDQSGTFTPDTSAVIFTATTSSSTLLNASTSLVFNNVTFGETSGTATWNITKPLVLSGSLNVNFGTLARCTSTITLAGNLGLGSGGTISGLSTTTFNGAGSNTWGDTKASSTNIGNVVVDGTSKTITLSGNVGAESVTIGADDTLNSSGSGFNIDVVRNWTNNNTFIPQNGTVSFVGTSSGIIARGTSAFNNLSFTGVGGSWAFSTSTLALNGNLTIATGSVTLPTGTTTIGGSFLNTGGTFLHNNGEVRMTSTSGGRTIAQRGTAFLNAFYDLVFSGTGGWAYSETNATTSRQLRIQSGTVTFPAGQLTIGGDLSVTGAGSFAHNNGEVVLLIQDTNVVRANGSPFNNIRTLAAGSSSWYNDAWTRRIPITILSSQIDANLTNFPVYVNLSNLAPGFFTGVKADGSDIRVTQSDGVTEVPLEVVSINTGTSVGEMYFRANSVSSSTDTTFYIYYGNAAASAYTATATFGARNVWSNGYVLVSHMNDLTNSTILNSAGATNGIKTNTSGNPVANNPLFLNTGYVYGAQDFSTTPIQFTGNYLNGQTQFNISMWFRPDDVAGSGGQDTSTFGNSLYGVSAGGNYDWTSIGGSTAGNSANGPEVCVRAFSNLVPCTGVTSGANITNGNWYHLSLNAVRNGAVTARVNGVTRGTFTAGNTDPSNTFTIAALRPNRTPPIVFDGRIDEVRVSTTTRTDAWRDAEYRNLATSTNFYTAGAVQNPRARTFTDSNATILGNFVSEIGGDTVLPTGVLSIGGSMSNSAVFSSNNGTVRFNSTAGAETIAAGSSTFATLEFNNAGGDFTITQNATATVAINLTSASQFTLQSGRTLAAIGTFNNAANGANTTWSGSTLLLTNGSTTLNAKTHGGDVYGTLRAASNTVARMWNSSADTYSTSGTTSAIYSQDHAAVDGDLNIYGNYVRTTGTEFWSYATDFDGVALIASTSRRVNVRVASSSSIGFTGATLNLVGTTSASTTINAIAGAFALSATNATVTAEHFTVAGTNNAGLDFRSSTTLSVFRDGFFTVVPGSTGITMSSTTVARNPSAQFFRIGFATTTAGSASNVTMVGTSSSFVWFREGTGNLYGEAFDANDANPGSIRFDDSSNSIVVSGIVYANDGTTPLGAPTCNGVAQNVRIVVDGGTYSSSTSCAAGTGVYSFPAVNYIGDPKVIVYLDTNGGVQGSVVTKTPTANITNMHIYANRVITRHQDIAPLTVADMTLFDVDNDSDVRFNASTTSLTVFPGTELFVFATTTFAPGGNVTLRGNASSTSFDGSLQIGNNATFTANGTEIHTLGGRLIVRNGGVFTPASSTVIFNATTTGKSVTASSTVTFNNVDFDGVAGGWNIGASIQVLGNMTVATGTVTGTGNITLVNGSLTGDGTLSLGSPSTVTINRTSTLGGSRAWTFNNLTLGNGSIVGTTTPASTATTTIAAVLTVSNAHFLKANDSRWDLAGVGGVLVETGTIIEDTSYVRYSGAGANVLSTGYFDLDINSGFGSQTYTATGLGVTVQNILSVGGSATSTFNVTTNDPVLSIGNDVLIRNNGTLIGSDSASFTVGRNWTSAGVYTSSAGTVTFNTASLTSIMPGGSSFGNVIVNGTGNFTIASSATTTGNLTLANHGNFTVASSQALAIGGTFTNALAGAATTWTGSTLHFYGGGTKSINASTTSDVYQTLSIAAGTNVRMWNSSATTYNALGGIYSQDHGGADGLLNIYGAVTVSSGNDFWSHGIDFDGTVLTSSSSRAVTVAFASSSSGTYTGGTLTVLGTSTASTSLQNQGAGTYGLTISTGATTNWNTVTIRNINSAGVVFSGTPTVTDFSRTDHLVAINGGTGMTVGGTVIDANQAKNFTSNVFATSSGITSASNVTATGTAISSWRFTNHSGNISGEARDNDPAGDPGYLVWDDSAALITVSGNVYSDEGVTVSTVCDGSTQNIILRVAGLTSYTSSCNAVTGAYSMGSVAFSPADSLIVYIDGNARKAVTVSADPISTISNMHLYENRVIVRHENTTPLSIADMATWDSSDDADIQYTATDAATDTLTLAAEQKLLIWNGKTFEPLGNVTVTGGGAGGPQDGTLEAQTNAVFRAVGAESHTVGGSLIFGTGAVFTAGQSTTTFTTTGAARTIDVNSANFHNVTFTGPGSWNVTDPTFTTSRSLSQTSGALTFGSGTTTIGASFNATGGTFAMPGSALVFTSTTTGNIVRLNNASVPSMRFAGSGGAWSMTDSNATTTGAFTIASGTVTLPSGNLGVGRNFENLGGVIAHNTADIIMTATSAASVTASGSDLFAIVFRGSGPYTITGPNVTFLDSFTIASGSVTMATGTTAIGGSFIVSSGSFAHSSGTVLLNSASAGRTVSPGNSSFSNLQIGAPTGGYTFASATTTGNFIISSVSNLVVSATSAISVGGVFTNSVGGAATTWTGSTLALVGQNAYSINSRANAGDIYGTLIIGNNTNIRSWYSSAATTTVASSASLYSQDNNNIDGHLYIFGNLELATTTEYWNRATDFDGTSLVGGERKVSVFMAPNATTTLLSGALEILGSSSSVSSVTALNASTTYALVVSGGTLNAKHYSFANLGVRGLQLSGTPVITDLSNGYFNLAIDGQPLITLASTTLNANPSKIFDTVGFNASSSLTGFNVELVGSSSNAWRFTNNFGNIGTEAFDIDGVTACGSVRFSDSSCLLTEQTHIRWRLNDGGIGVPNSEWYDGAWDFRKSVRFVNTANESAPTTSLKMTVTYDSDMKTDFADLRFTGRDGITVYPHWIERFTASTDAVVWVRVPSVAALDTTTVYMYYGNPTASSTSAATSTFAAVDTFDDNNITEYSGDTGLFQTDTSPVYGGAYALEAFNQSARTTDGIFRTDLTVSQGQLIRWMQYIDITGTGDEACTLFGVQTPGTNNNNYAVCLEQFGTDRIALSRNVSDNDVSGTVLATSSVTFATGWYEVEVDWKTDNTITASLYNSSGALVTSVTATDSNYTSGGIGFSYWFQKGSWDSYVARARGAGRPTVFFGAEQVDGGASYVSAQDAVGNAYQPGSVARLRVAIENSGLDITGQQFRLEYAAKGVAPSCESVSSGSYTQVPNQASCGSSPICMATSSQLTNGASVSDLLTGTNGTYQAGQVVTSPSSQTTAFDVNQNSFTELEYAITPTLTASDSYCFRVTNAGTPLDFYAKVAELGLQFDPTVSSVAFNQGNPITLTPGTTTLLIATTSVTDFNGFGDLQNATATFYRTLVGASCTADDNNCFRGTVTGGQCSFVNCAGNRCDLSCAAQVPFHTDATDIGTYAGQEWFAFMEVSDTGNRYGFNSSPGIELLTLRAISVNSAINYGALAVNTDTGSFNPTTTVTNLGNVPINLEIQGTDLSDGGNSAIPANQQKFATSTFSYTGCLSCSTLSSSTPVSLTLNLSKPTVVVPPVQSELYWGIAIPFGINSSAHTGYNLFTPIDI